MMSFRLKLSRRNKRDFEKQLSKSYSQGKQKEVSRLLGILSLSEGRGIEDIAVILRKGISTVYKWLSDFLTKGLSGLLNREKVGRPCKLTKGQKRQLITWIEAGPEKCGFQGSCWRTPMIGALIQERFGILYNVHYLSELLNNLGFTYQKAKFIAAKQDEKARQEWLEHTWPEILKTAGEKEAHILFGDEASFPQWGTLSYTWARRGEQPVVKTSGNRRSYKVLGMIEYFTGKVFARGHDGRLNATVYEAYLKEILSQTRKHLIVIHDGASYHKSASLKRFFAAHADRLTVYLLPSYSPDFNPIEGLWKKIKQQGTHLKYFPTFEDLVSKVNEMCVAFKSASEEILNLFGFYTKKNGDTVYA